MLDRRGFLLSACASLAAVPLAGLASEHGGRKVVDGFTSTFVCGHEFKDLHFRTPIRTRHIQACSFINCTYNDVLIEAIPGKNFYMVNCLFRFPQDYDGRGFITR